MEALIVSFGVQRRERRRGEAFARTTMKLRWKNSMG
jgi:hypothetical protein